MIYCLRGFIGVFLGDALRTFWLWLLCFLSNCIVQQIAAICLISPWFDACPLQLGAVPNGPWGSCTYHHSCEFGWCQDKSDGAHDCWSVLPKVQCRHSSDFLHCTLGVPAAHVLYICHLLWQNSSIILATDLSEQRSAQPLQAWCCVWAGVAPHAHNPQNCTARNLSPAFVAKRVKTITSNQFLN